MSGFRMSVVLGIVYLLCYLQVCYGRLEKAYGRPALQKRRNSVKQSNQSVNVPYRRVFINPATSAPFVMDDISFLLGETLHPQSRSELERLPQVVLGDNPCGGYERQSGCRNKTLQYAACPHQGDGSLVARLAQQGDWGLSKTQCEESVAGQHGKYVEQSKNEKVPFLSVLAGDNAYWRGTCSDHFESFRVSAVRDGFDFASAAGACTEPSTLASYYTSEKTLKRRLSKNSVRKEVTENSGFASFGDSVGFGKAQYRGSSAPFHSVPKHAKVVPAFLRDKGLPSPFVIDESVPRVVQWVQRVEYIRSILTRQATPSLRVFGVQDVNPVVFDGYTDEEALEYVQWQFPQVGSYEEFVKDTKVQSKRQRFDPNTGYQVFPGSYLDLDVHGKVIAVHGLHPALASSLLEVYALEEHDVGLSKALLSQLKQAEMKTWMDVSEFLSLKTAPNVFPTPGNHDYDMLYSVRNDLPYTQYFRYLDLLPPGGALHNGLFYQVQLRAQGVPVLGLFSISSVIGGHGHAVDDYALRIQMEWLRMALGNSPARFNIVVFHHPPQTSNINGGQYQYMNFPFKKWGADVVVTGHQHIYERVQPGADQSVYFVNGLGGHNWVYGIHNCNHISGSQFQFNQAHGMLVADQYVGKQAELAVCFVSTRDGASIEDHVSLYK